MDSASAANHAARDATACADFAGQRKCASHRACIHANQLRAVLKQHGAKWRAISFAFTYYIFVTNLGKPEAAKMSATHAAICLF